MGRAAQFAGTAVPGSAAEVGSQGPVAPGVSASPYLGRKVTGPVGAALGEYLEKRQKDMTSVAERIEACVLGAAKATNEYLEGDLDQAKQAQDAARAVNLQVLREQPGGAK
ncbi:DUF6507 family protein [Streptomyces sp. NPDC059851]|uniref:DUF6507 family protein n=1 Tax=Streptomyces sp. NPDC059851 TaxID=3346971 RepID=UPI003652E806